MDAGFKEDINNPDVSPREIFELYGTHVIRAVKWAAVWTITPHPTAFITARPTALSQR